MPLDGNQVASKPAGTTAVPNTVVASAPYNATVDDIYNIFNTKVQPVAFGGTGATTATGARDALGLEIDSDIPSIAAISGMIYGLTLSNNVTDATNDIDIAAGSAIDSANTNGMSLASAITKRLDAVWAVGTNQGMLASGAAIADTTYHVFLIKRPDTGVVDIAADTSVTGANLAANTNAAYTLKRRVGSIIRAGGAIRAFVQYGDDFYLSIPSTDLSSANPGTSATLVGLVAPSGLVVKAIMGVLVYTTANSNVAALITSPSTTDVAPTASLFTICGINIATGSGAAASGVTEVHTDTSARVRARISFSDAGTQLRITTFGWKDTRQ